MVARVKVFSDGPSTAVIQAVGVSETGVTSIAPSALKDSPPSLIIFRMQWICSSGPLEIKWGNGESGDLLFFLHPNSTGNLDFTDFGGLDARNVANSNGEILLDASLLTPSNYTVILHVGKKLS